MCDGLHCTPVSVIHLTYVNMAHDEQLRRAHAEGDLQLLHCSSRPASGQVSQQIKMENFVRCLEHYFGSDLRILQNGAEGMFSIILACRIDAAVTCTVCPECPGHETHAGAHVRIPGVEFELDQLLKVCSDIISQRDSLSLTEKFQAGAFFLGRFLSIGAFSNGNGRTGRLLTSVLLMRLGAADVPLRFDLPRESDKRFAQALEIAKTAGWRGDWREAMASEALRELVEFMRDAEENTRRLHDLGAAALP